MNVVIVSEKAIFSHIFQISTNRKALQLYKSIVFQNFKSLSLPDVKWRPFPFVAIYVKNVFSLANTVKVIQYQNILSLNMHYIS